jgi:hypothetical protein
MTRNTNAWRTQERAEKFRQLVDAFGHAELTTAQMAAQLTLSLSSARAYRDDLLAAGVIGLARILPPKVLRLQGEHVFQLVGDAALVEAFIEGVRTGTIKRVEEDPVALPVSSGRRFHVGFADPRRALQVCEMPAFRDWAVAALFGPAPASGACA